MSRVTRRTFIKRAAATAGIATSFAIGGTKASGSILGANDTIRLGVAGINGRGSSHIDQFASMDGVDVTYLIDPDTRTHERRAPQVKARGGNTPKCVQDIRKALDDKNLDAISVATCNHWHSLITFWSCQAGKDVYVEKPLSHNIFEGGQCVKAAEKYKRIVQHGTQSRASAGWARAVAAVASGKYGKLLVSKAWASKPGKGRRSIGYKEDMQPPAEMDFNLWLGPAQEMPYNENMVPYNWHWFWATGNGEIGNQGVHQMDIARWAIPGPALPESVISMGGRWVEGPDFKDQAETPNCQVTVMDFGGPLLVFEVMGLVDYAGVDGKKYPRKVGNEFFMEEGVIKDGKFYANGSDKGEELPKHEYEKGYDSDKDSKSDPNFKNFIDCIRSRDRDKLYADVTEAHPSAACCHLGNISYRLGEQVSGATRPDVLDKHEEVAKSFDFMMQIVKGTLGLDLAKNTYQLGPKLKVDAKTEKFVGNAKADALLTRDYRKPFVVTEEV